MKVAVPMRLRDFGVNWVNMSSPYFELRAYLARCGTPCLGRKQLKECYDGLHSCSKH
jgi:hypothetical protein